MANVTRLSDSSLWGSCDRCPGVGIIWAFEAAHREPTVVHVLDIPRYYLKRNEYPKPPTR